MTTAIRALKAAGVAFEPRPYEYVEHGGTSVAAEQLQLDEHAVIKTIVLETDEKKPLIVLMHGDRFNQLDETDGENPGCQERVAVRTRDGIPSHGIFLRRDQSVRYAQAVTCLCGRDDL